MEGRGRVSVWSSIIMSPPRGKVGEVCSQPVLKDHGSSSAKQSQGK